MYKYYFSSKFTVDGIPTELATKLTPPPQTNNLRPLGGTEFKDLLTGAMMEEKQVLEKKNMTVIERVYQRLKDDKEIQGRIRGCG